MASLVELMPGVMYQAVLGGVVYFMLERVAYGDSKFARTEKKKKNVSARRSALSCTVQYCISSIIV